MSEIEGFNLENPLGIVLFDISLVTYRHSKSGSSDVAATFEVIQVKVSEGQH